MSSHQRHIAPVYLSILLVCLPGILYLIGYPKSEPLSGAYTVPPKPKFQWEKWFSGDLQEQIDDFLSLNLTLKPEAVRWANQFHYSVLGRPNTRYVVKGKNEYLYEDAYIKAHYGMDFKGAQHWEEKGDRLEGIGDRLKEKGVELLVVLAPGKGSFYPEYIPDRYLTYKREETNFEALRTQLDEHDIAYLDLKSWFEDMKENSRARMFLFPKTGTHWSTYGMHLAADSILRYLDGALPGDQPRWEIGLSDLSEVLRDQDRDIEEGLNLKYPIEKFPMPYPKFAIIDSAKQKIRTAVVADSYFWNMYNKGFCTQATDSSEFWYYAAQVYPQSFNGNYPLTAEHIKETLPKLDCIILLSTDGTLDRFPWGIDDLMEEALK